MTIIDRWREMRRRQRARHMLAVLDPATLRDLGLEVTPDRRNIVQTIGEALTRREG